jgi:hypothetical protein
MEYSGTCFASRPFLSHFHLINQVDVAEYAAEFDTGTAVEVFVLVVYQLATICRRHIKAHMARQRGEAPPVTSPTFALPDLNEQAATLTRIQSYAVAETRVPPPPPMVRGGRRGGEGRAHWRHQAERRHSTSLYRVSDGRIRPTPRKRSPAGLKEGEMCYDRLLPSFIP